MEVIREVSAVLGIKHPNMGRLQWTPGKSLALSVDYPDSFVNAKTGVADAWRADGERVALEAERSKLPTGIKYQPIRKALLLLNGQAGLLRLGGAQFLHAIQSPFQHLSVGVADVGGSVKMEDMTVTARVICADSTPGRDRRDAAQFPVSLQAVFKVFRVLMATPCDQGGPYQYPGVCSHG